MTPGQSNAYLVSRVKSATPGGLIVLLYEGLIRFASEARDALCNAQADSQQTIEAALKVRRCIDILTALNTSLRQDVDPAFTGRMSDLYLFFTDKLSDALKTRDPSHIDGIIPLIQELHDAWQEADLGSSSNS